MTRFTQLTFMALLYVFAVMTPANAQTGAAAEQVTNPASPEAEKKLVEGLTPVKPMIRFRRFLNSPKPARPVLQQLSYALANTREARAGDAELEKGRNLTGVAF